MANIKEAFSTIQTMSSTSLNVLTASSSLGWESSAIDNSVNLYLDALVQVNIAFGASAPAGDKALYIYAYGALSGTFPTPITGSQGLLTATSSLACRLAYTLVLGTTSVV